jgi:hypothetical protein
MSTHVHYEARTVKGAVIQTTDLQHRAEAAVNQAILDGMDGAHVVMVTTVVTELRVYDPGPLAPLLRAQA